MELLVGGLGDNKTVKDISNKFNLPINDILKQVNIGLQIEMEHTNSKDIAYEIVLDHLTEIPDYYTRLVKMEKEAKMFWDKKNNNILNIKDLIREFLIK